MKVDVKMAGNSYSGVPSVLSPLKSGGKARFCEVSDTTAKASDVAQGKTFYDADGNYTEGTRTGSGGTAAEAAPYRVTIQQVPHQTIEVTFTPKVTGNLTGFKKSGSQSAELTSEANLALSYAFDAEVIADSGWIKGNPTISGALKNGLICGDVVISATEAIEDASGLRMPVGYIPLYLSDGRLYMDKDLQGKFNNKSLVKDGTKLFIVDITKNTTSMNGMFNPSNVSFAEGTLAESVIDFSNVEKGAITDLGVAFAGNQKLESLDLSGFGNVTAMYSMCAFCSSLKCVYIDTLSNSKNKTINTYHMFAPCSSLEYLIIDNVNVDFVMQDAADADKGVPASAKILVPRAALDAYKADSHWKSAADRILAMEDFDIVRKDGVVTVTPKAV